MTTRNQCLYLIFSITVSTMLLFSTGAAAQTVFQQQVLNPLAEPIRLGSLTPPKGIPNIPAANKAIVAWDKAKVGCKPGGEFEKIPRFKAKCAELLNSAAAVKNYLIASANGLISVTLVKIATKLGEFKTSGMLTEELYRLFMEAESTIEQEKATIMPIFAAAGVGFPENLAKDIKEIQGMFLKSVEVWSTAKSTAASTIKSDRALLDLETKCVAKDVTFGTMVNGKWEKVKGKVKAAKYLEGDWTIVKDSMDRTVSRWKSYTSIISVPGEKFCRKAIAVAGSNHFHSQKFVGGKFESGGGVACELIDYAIVSCD